MDPDKISLKLKISQTLNNLNQSSQVFVEMINDYNTLYKKYMNIQKIPEQNQRLYSFQIKPEEVIKTDQTELEKKYNLIEEQYLKKKTENEKNIEEINKKMQQIMELKNKLDIKDKKINGYSAENSALKQQNMILDKKNKELNETNDKNDKLIFELNKYNQKLEIDHKKLVDSAGKMHMEIDKLRTKLLEMQEHTINKVNKYNELMETAKQKQIYFKEKSETFDPNNNNRINFNEISPSDAKIKIPNKLKYKTKNHYNRITSINFNNSGSSYLTAGEDSIIHIYESDKNLETYEFSDFSDIVTEACFDNNENFLFAGSYDKTAKLYSLKSYKLSYNFIGHNDKINCLKTFNNNPYGLTGSSDKTIKEWDFNNKKMNREVICNSECHSLEISPDDNFFLSGHLDGTVKLFGIKDKSEKLFNLHNDKVLDVKLIKNDLFLTLGKDKQIKLFDLRNEKVIYTIDENKISENYQSSITISPDKKYFACGTDKGMIYIININDGNIDYSINNNKGSGSVTGICWKPNSSIIYAGDSNGFLSIWGTDFD